MTRFNMPEIDFVDVDASTFENIGVSKFEELMGVTLSESDPRRKLFQSIAFLLTVSANNTDYTGKQLLLTYASDNYLDHYGAGKDVFRLEPIPAKTIIRYEVNNPNLFTIPAGNRLSVNDIVFYTVEDKEVPIGTQYIDIKAECEEPGSLGNGFLPGQIENIVDPLPWVTKAYNITESSGGSDRETDDAFAERIRNANEGYSTTGPDLAYQYHARSANQRIIDVEVLSPAPSEIEIVVLMAGGEIPSQAELEEVLNACSPRDVRPLTDKVTVVAPAAYVYDLTVEYYLPQSSIDQKDTIQANVEDALADYTLWQKSKLGRGIDPSELYARLQAAGAKRISVTPNQYIELTRKQFAKEGIVTLTFGGFIND
ncbi:baseplate assembly protein [Cytobacillus firmus]|uniref:baseplate assembly protein n=1 Tax=Cytobacillus firmus TaxID=1399 RepID=UPI0018CEAB32|nr:baseplate J/gp47 family protein [Cytobacillus firmus]MBG9548383.1 hypothetical protein [Cytobacillus firmus]MBG9603986.1 hypothetical protein [Cytobacillus firmus]MED1941624.1 baseplate J/gp47 family protein [Cytobacillus firmus]